MSGSRFKTPEERWEYEKTEGKQKRLNRYKQLTRKSDDELQQLTEETIDDQAFQRTCVEMYCNPSLFRAELLHKDKEYWEKDRLEKL